VDTLFPLIIGLVGVLVGAVITTGANYLLATRAERAEEAKDKHFRAIELKTAARLITNEFLAAHVIATTLVEEKRWVHEKLPLDAWQRDSRVLARELPFSDWNAVNLAAWAVKDFRNFTTTPRSSDNASDAMAETGKPVLRDLNAGLDALRPYM
jgi:hypothetical protein